MVMDSKPFGGLHHILQEVADDRIWIFAEWVSSLRNVSAPACSRHGDMCAVCAPAILHRLAWISHQKSMDDGQQIIMSVFTTLRTMPSGVSRAESGFYTPHGHRTLHSWNHLLTSSHKHNVCELVQLVLTILSGCSLQTAIMNTARRCLATSKIQEMQISSPLISTAVTSESQVNLIPPDPAIMHLQSMCAFT